ncbi:DUF4245 domain-containing protein [Aeromicrobium sp. Sec7.5]|uniref:DUF4245 domain-containing protein n=1 Tax=Aeromicrobium sp. Sec7.5 TaxID=3121276 RepID=UPI002FE47943
MSERQPAPKRSRGNPSMGDVVRSVVVLSIIVLGIWVFGLLQTDTPEDPIGDSVPYAATAESARDVATYGLLAPANLPDDWRVNGVRFAPTGTQAWHLGVLTDEDRYIGLEQEKESVDDLVQTHAEGAEEAGTLDIDGVVWQRFDGPGKSVTLVQETPEVTTLVTTSTAPLEDVEDFVRRLTTS